MAVEHSPLPWRLDGKELWSCLVAAKGQHVVCMGHDYDDGGLFASEADAAFIVDACNQHHALVAQRDALLAALKGLVPFGPPPADARCHNGITTQENCGLCARYIAAQAAIDKAEGRHV